jgi:acyl transferase domain-containing protein
MGQLHQALCTAALSLATNICLSCGPFIVECAARMLSVGGRCFTFDASADGYARGEGSGAVVLVNAADTTDILHVGGSAVNQDGRSASLTAPNGPSQ